MKQNRVTVCVHAIIVLQLMWELFLFVSCNVEHFYKFISNNSQYFFLSSSLHRHSKRLNIGEISFRWQIFSEHGDFVCVCVCEREREKERERENK